MSSATISGGTLDGGIGGGVVIGGCGGGCGGGWGGGDVTIIDVVRPRAAVVTVVVDRIPTTGDGGTSSGGH